MQAIHAELKKRHRATRECIPNALNLCIHRALSWLQRASVCEPDHDHDPDARFIFLWIAFSAAYAQEIPHHLRLSEQENVTTFLRKLHGARPRQRQAAGQLGVEHLQRPYPCAARQPLCF